VARNPTANAGRLRSRGHGQGVAGASAGPAPPAARQPARGKARITLAAILETAFAIVEAEGYEALTMRRVAAALETGPASLYGHVRNKAALDDLLIGELCSTIDLPLPSPRAWRAQILEVCAQLRDRYLRYPGISRAALAFVPTNLKTLRLNEGLLAILLAGGVAPQPAAWTIDALFLYVSAYCLERSLLHQQTGDAGSDRRVLTRTALVERFARLPVDSFPNTVRFADELTSGQGHERFEFTIALLLDGLTQR
jgi:AcrR family transcriptional regulator